MPDWNRPKRVRNMRRVLRQHGAPVPRKGCLGVLMLVTIAIIFTMAGAYGMRGR